MRTDRIGPKGGKKGNGGEESARRNKNHLAGHIFFRSVDGRRFGFLGEGGGRGTFEKAAGRTVGKIGGNGRGTAPRRDSALCARTDRPGDFANSGSVYPVRIKFPVAGLAIDCFRGRKRYVRQCVADDAGQRTCATYLARLFVSFTLAGFPKGN